MRIWLLPCLSLAACTMKADPDATGSPFSDADTDSDTDADTDADTDSDTDADTDADTDTAPPDSDRDGWADDEDCAPDDDEVHPGAREVPYDGVDNDCDAASPDDDLDRDGHGVATDCDDADAAVSPDAAEIAGNGVDDDCDAGTCQGNGFDTTATVWPIPQRYTYGTTDTSSFESTADSGDCYTSSSFSAFTTFDIDADGFVDLVETGHCGRDDVGTTEWWVYLGQCDL